MKIFFGRCALLLLLFLFAGCVSRQTEAWMIRSNEALGIPVKSDQMLIRKGFTVGYDWQETQALWVSYILYGDNLRRTPVPRSNIFLIDHEVGGVPADPRDFQHSGFDRGHLAPAADMAYSKETMTESFLLSNISPQTPECNRFEWLEWEKRVRRWALKEECIYVITGPVFSPGEKKKLGKSNITIPAGFYKAVMDLTPPYKMIACYVSNEKKSKSRILSVNELERITGYDFFDKLDDKLENELESQYDLTQWE